ESTAKTTSVTSTVTSAMNHRGGMAAAIFHDAEPRPVGLGGDGKDLPKSPDDGVSFRVWFLVAVDEQLHAGGDQQASEEVHGPMEPLQERAAGEDEGAAHDQGADDAPEKHAVLVRGGDAEGGKDDDEHEDVVDGERLLDQVAGRELHRSLRTEPAVDRRREQRRQSHPDHAPDAGLLERDRMCLAVED